VQELPTDSWVASGDLDDSFAPEHGRLKRRDYDDPSPAATEALQPNSSATLIAFALFILSLTLALEGAYVCLRQQTLALPR
jgi:uncharacterized protein HemX